MTHRFVVLTLFIAILAGFAQAMLPPDAKAREPQIRARLRQVRADYETKQVERQAQAALAREKTQADIFTPPWMRIGAQTAVRSGTVADAETAKAAKRNYRFLISAVLLILTGILAGWARYATRDADR